MHPLVSRPLYHSFAEKRPSLLCVTFTEKETYFDVEFDGHRVEIALPTVSARSKLSALTHARSDPMRSFAVAVELGNSRVSANGSSDLEDSLQPPPPLMVYFAHRRITVGRRKERASSITIPIL